MTTSVVSKMKPPPSRRWSLHSTTSLYHISKWTHFHISLAIFTRPSRCCVYLFNTVSVSTKFFSLKDWLWSIPRIISCHFFCPKPFILWGIKAHLILTDSNGFRKNTFHGLPQNMFDFPVPDDHITPGCQDFFHQAMIQERHPCFQGKAH